MVALLPVPSSAAAAASSSAGSAPHSVPFASRCAALSALPASASKRAHAVYSTANLSPMRWLLRNLNVSRASSSSLRLHADDPSPPTVRALSRIRAHRRRRWAFDPIIHVATRQVDIDTLAHYHRKPLLDRFTRRTQLPRGEVGGVCVVCVSRGLRTLARRRSLAICADSRGAWSCPSVGWSWWPTRTSGTA